MSDTPSSKSIFLPSRSWASSMGASLPSPSFLRTTTLVSCRDCSLVAMNVVNTKKCSSGAERTFEETVKSSSLSLVGNPWVLRWRSHGGLSQTTTERAGTHGIHRKNIVAVARSFVKHPYYLPPWQVLLVRYLILYLDFIPLS